ncbi:MAG: urease accessory protein UreE [Sarcina sp.]
MILDKILGNIHEGYEKTPHMEKIYLKSDELLKRINRVTSDHGHEYGITLDKKEVLKDGDILFNDGHNMIIVVVKSDDVLIIKPETIDEMGRIAHNLGNRHLPAQFRDGMMILEYDKLVEDLLKEEGIKYSRENVTLEKAFRHVEFGHKHV